ncbi:cupin domain-containing protein [Xanthocytophaga agilis]|uniref:Cupin domain-containing protein n=1 Tax=Xanthocytophaga agilis TaxID=3048010 RepID=A0AAE3UJX9_9BACT|nr:cupin domain-containing protein [Xanthocytophaga agilis]MDJ1505908.1 cupin domain-containing protein [Xanthocytophaga agilis]
MHRRSFLSLPALAPFSFIPLSFANDRPDKGIRVDAGKDRFNKSFMYLGARFDLKVSGKDTDGAMSIYDTTRFEKIGPPLHKHTNLDEWFFVMEGEFKVQIGQDIFRLKAGDSVFGPRGVAHTFVKTSDTVGRLLLIHQPAGTMEEYFEQIIQLKSPTPEQKKALLIKHHMEAVGPALSPD